MARRESYDEKLYGLGHGPLKARSGGLGLSSSASGLGRFVVMMSNFRVDPTEAISLRSKNMAGV